MDYKSLSTYDYELPEERIAQSPIEPRDHSRLLVYDRKSGEIFHKHFYDLPEYLTAGDVLVLNNTRVIPARLYGFKGTGAKIETLLLKRITIDSWEVLLKPAKRLKIGEVLHYSNELSATLVEIKGDGNRVLKFKFDGVFEDIIARVGTMPLPPYIHEKLENNERYQTVYSKVEGSSAAPTAGLHFTPELLEKIKGMGVQICEVTLDVGLGTFRPCKEEDITKHNMHSESYFVPSASCEIINKAKFEGRRIICVGTTSVRTLESIAQYGFPLKERREDTSIFIYPPYQFKLVDALITNFHLPKSTLLMLVSALVGVEEIKKIYKVAVEEKYRFFSFGDAMLIL